MGLRARSIVPHLDMDNKEQLLFRCHSSDPLEHPSYRHMVVLSNLYNAPLRFCVYTQAPFSITALAPSVPQARGAAEGDKFHQAVFELPPRENLNVEVQFEPPEEELGEGALSDPRFAGKLVAFFIHDPEAAYHEVVTSTPAEMTQSLPLVAEHVVPRLTCSHDTVRFRRVHPTAPRAMEVTLTNPTTADAEWEARLVTAAEAEAAGASEDGAESATGERDAGAPPPSACGRPRGTSPGAGWACPARRR